MPKSKPFRFPTSPPGDNVKVTMFKVQTRFDTLQCELFKGDGKWHSQNVLCRGIVGQGSTQKVAIKRMLEKLGYNTSAFEFEELR